MRKINSTILSVACVSVALASLSSCNNGSTVKTTTTTDSSLADSKRIDSLTSQKKKVIDSKFATLELNSPSPFDVVNDLHNYQAPFKKELLNSETNVDKYTTPFKKEVNFGVYGVDLAYINFYGQNQDMMKYYDNINKLAEDLKLDKVFEGYADRFKNNVDNRRY